MPLADGGEGTIYAVQVMGPLGRPVQIVAAFSIVSGPCSLHEAFDSIQDWAADRTEQILRLI